MAWKKGPLPSGTYGWGGVVPFDEKVQGFYFADFAGNTVKAIGAGPHGKTDRILQPHEVAFYDNSLELPPTK